MTYRGVYRDGIVILQGQVDLRNGEAVEVNARRGGMSSASQPAPKVRRSASAKSKKLPLPGFGAWKDRKDIEDSVDFARSLRRRSSARRS